jgi:hypothetical protein
MLVKSQFLEKRRVEWRPQFNLRTLLLATFWVVIWFGNIACGTQLSALAGDWIEAYLCVYWSLLLLPPAAIVGVLWRHPYLGLFCGLGSAVAFQIHDWLWTFYEN